MDPQQTDEPIEDPIAAFKTTTAQAAAKSPAQGDTLTPTESLMLQLSHNFIHAINTRQFSTALALQEPSTNTDFGVAINFSAQLVNYPKMSSWNEYVESFRDMVVEWPEYCITLISSTVSLDQVRDKADVFLLAEETGKPPGVRTVAPSRLEWVKVGSKWMLSKHLMFRGAEMDPMGSDLGV